MHSENKPRLYHASSNRDIKIFEPRQESVRDPNEGPVVFATPDPAYASCFIVKCNDSWSKLGRWGSGNGVFGPWVMVVADMERFESLDRGGKIYELPNETFETDPERGSGLAEWVSKAPVKPLPNSMIYESGFEAMIDHKVQVFFADQNTIDRMHKSRDHGYSVVYEMQRKGMSENQRLGKNVVFLE